MSRKRIVAALAVMAWILLGPIAMAFGACGILGVTCDGACGALASATQAPLPERLMRHVASIAAAPEEQLATGTRAVLEPPPKSAPSLT
jgi:hypothetical protein